MLSKLNLTARSALFMAGALALVFSAGCSCSGSDTATGPCDAPTPAAECGQDCSAAGSACAAGFYCGADMTCTADCSAAGGCMATEQCSADGHCVPGDGADGAVVADTGTSGTDGGGAPADSGNVCADVSVTADPVIPSVVLIVDQSGSMDRDLGSSGVRRWDALEEALVGANGVAGVDGMGAGATGLVHLMQPQVRFGVALYTTDITNCSNTPPPVMQLTKVPDLLSGVSLNGYAPIKVAYDAAAPLGRTPTHLAMAEVLNDVLADPPPDPVVFILATDGQPNDCDGGVDAQAAVIGETQRAFAAGIKTYVISLTGGDAALQAHLDEVANAGIGNDPALTPPAMSWAPADTSTLQTALQTIIGSTLSCTLTLNGTITDTAQACSGTVLLNGSPLVCDDPNGWRAVDANHIEVQGTACDTLLGTPGSTLNATFPCDVVLLL